MGHDLDAKRLLFATEGRVGQTVVEFAADPKARGGDPPEVHHACMDMSAAYATDVGLELPQAQISDDRFHVAAIANEAMDQVRRAEMQDDVTVVREPLGGNDRKTLKQLKWDIRRNPSGWSRQLVNAMHWLQSSARKSERAWLLKMALREVCAAECSHNNPEKACADLRPRLSWARRCRPDPFKKLATTPKDRFDAVVRGMIDHRSNAFVEAMNGLLQQAKRAARGFRTAANFISIACLRMSSSSICLPIHSAQPACN